MIGYFMKAYYIFNKISMLKYVLNSFFEFFLLLYLSGFKNFDISLYNQPPLVRQFFKIH